MKRLTPAATVALLAAWALLLLATHHGPRSPYTYISELTFGESPLSDLGRVAAPDALTVLPVTRFFYDGTPPADYSKAHNLWLPLHSFAVAIGLSFVRDYLVANSLINFLFLMILTVAAVRFGLCHGLRPAPLLLGMATLFALPPVVACIGQPLHYIVGPAITFLLMLSVMAFDENDLRNPWIVGALTAVLTLNYHWYAFVAALIVYLALIRFPRRRDDALFVFVAATPVILWEVFLRAITAGHASATIRNRLVLPVVFEWVEFLRHPIDRVMMPLIATHVGAAFSFHHLISLIHWPLVFVLIVALWVLRPRAPRLLVLLVMFFVIEQLLSAPFDFENSPRRAFPAFFAFACAYCFSVDRLSSRRAWLAVFVAMFAFSTFFAFADVVFDRGGGAFLYVGEAVRVPMDALRYESRTLPREPAVARDPQNELRAAFPAARYRFTWPFVVAQLFVAFWMTMPFWIAARARLLPRAAPWIAGGVWIASLVARPL